MHPPWSMIFFTTLAGAAQGLMLTLLGVQAAATFGFMATSRRADFPLAGAGIVLLLCVVALVAATFHLGRPMRAWRAAAMWRTSWLSREVIVLPAFMVCVVGWAWSQSGGRFGVGWSVASAVLALLLYVCTGMIYAAVRAIPQWATPMTPINFILLGLASGMLMGTALAALHEPTLVAGLSTATVIALLIAATTRALTMHRNLTLTPKTTTQSALGVRHPRIVQTSQGMSAGTFGTREFFHGATPGTVRTVRAAAVVLGALVPLGVLAVAGTTMSALAMVLLSVVQMVGLWAERWSFFTEGQHPQNLYQQMR